MPARWVFELDGEAATEALGAELSMFARPGQIIQLLGELGVGKTVLARGFIRALAGGGANLEIPSPTFTLVQIYDALRVPVAHADLYRIREASEVEELGLADLAATHVTLIEWPEKADPTVSEDVLRVELSGAGTQRRAVLTPSGNWTNILERNAAIHRFLNEASWRNAVRQFLEGDASSRRYEMLLQPDADAILMDMPARPDGPPVRDGLPYSRIAHLAEDIRSVVAVNDYLNSLGYSAPRIESVDLSAGLAVIENLGSRVYGRMRLLGENMHEPMRAAVELLADMAGRDWPETVPLRNDLDYALHNYDRGAMSIEVGLLPTWFWPYAFDKPIGSDQLAAFEACWEELFPHTATHKPVWTFRDFHSPNLIWMPHRSGIQRVGLIDTQDCLLGHPAFDLVSLLQDARVDISENEQDDLFAYYRRLRASSSFDAQGLTLAYSILGAQRATKILGIFARLSKRDGKHGYLKHVPRVSRYLERNLAHPQLAKLKLWYDTHLPASIREKMP
jgi:hypothetical protein